MSSKTVLLASVALVAVAFISTSANAADAMAPAKSAFYVSVFGGASLLNDVSGVYNSTVNIVGRFNTGYLLGGAIGAHISDHFRAEVELSHSSWGLKDASIYGGPFMPASGTANATYLMGNLWYDFSNGSAFTPYVGGGLGAAWSNLQVNAGPVSSTSTNLAFQIGVGAKYAISDNIDLDIGYRFKDVQNVNWTEPSGTLAGVGLVSHNIQAGITFNF
jgi:opacity protein-like surface antigen